LGRCDCVGSFAFVVAVTAIAAFLQIRHVRNSNEVTVNLRLGDRLESLDLAGAFTTIDPFLERLVTDPAFRFRLPQPGFMEEFANVAALLRFRVVSRNGSSSQSTRTTSRTSGTVSRYQSIFDVSRLARTSARHFEHLAMRAKDHIAIGKMDRFYGRLERDPRLATFVRPHADAT